MASDYGVTAVIIHSAGANVALRGMESPDKNARVRYSGLAPGAV
jgi:hypothetical protein